MNPVTCCVEHELERQLDEKDQTIRSMRNQIQELEKEIVILSREKREHVTTIQGLEEGIPDIARELLDTQIKLAASNQNNGIMAEKANGLASLVKALEDANHENTEWVLESVYDT